MIVSCPACAARVRLDRQRLEGKRLTLRCARCREVYKIEVPRQQEKSDAGRVLVAHSDASLCAAIEDVLNEGNLACRVVHDGPDALAAMEDQPPQVAIIDVALPGLYAFEVVEKVRRRPGLDKVKLILLSSVYNKTAYKRTPSSLYGADDYIEKHHIADDLVPKINRLLVDAVPGGQVHEPDASVTPGIPLAAAEKERFSADFIEKTNEKIREAETEEISSAVSAEAVEKAERLARIIVSDIALYNQDRVEEGIRTGSFFEVLADEIEEGKKLFRERVSSDIPRRDEILAEAFEAFVDRRSREQA